jgi:hypothetical protein
MQMKFVLLLYAPKIAYMVHALCQIHVHATEDGLMQTAQPPFAKRRVEMVEIALHRINVPARLTLSAKRVVFQCVTKHATTAEIVLPQIHAHAPQIGLVLIVHGQFVTKVNLYAMDTEKVA